jgi:hypothetical protein
LRRLESTVCREATGLPRQLSILDAPAVHGDCLGDQFNLRNQSEICPRSPAELNNRPGRGAITSARCCYLLSGGQVAFNAGRYRLCADRVQAVFAWWTTLFRLQAYTRRQKCKMIVTLVSYWPPGATSPAPGLFPFVPHLDPCQHIPLGELHHPVSIRSAAGEYIPLGGAVLLVSESSSTCRRPEQTAHRRIDSGLPGTPLELTPEENLGWRPRRPPLPLRRGRFQGTNAAGVSRFQTSGYQPGLGKANCRTHGPSACQLDRFFETRVAPASAFRRPTALWEEQPANVSRIAQHARFFKASAFSLPGGIKRAFSRASMAMASGSVASLEG